MSEVTRLDYCQFLLVSQTNYTLTYFAEHSPGFSHDAVKRYLEEEKLTARMVWENVRGQVVRSQDGYLAFDETVLDHRSSFKIELVRRQYSGNAHDVIKGIGVVTCVYINPEEDQFWIIDYRIYDPDRDGKTKLDHVREMLSNALSDKGLPFRGVLMDSWYAERKLMLYIERLNKVYYCPLKDNRQVDDSLGTHGYQRVDSLKWTEGEGQQGKTLHIKDFPKGHQVKLFRLVLSPSARTILPPTIWLRIPYTTHDRCVPCVGRLSSFTAKPNKPPVLKAVSVVWHVFSATILRVPSWSGFVSSKSLRKPLRPCISLNKACWTIICVLNCVHLLSLCSLRKSYGQVISIRIGDS